MAKILIVEDEETIAEIFVRFVGAVGYEAAHAKNGREGVALLRKENFDLMLVDLIMPVMNGDEMLKQADKEQCLVPFFLFTGAYDSELLDYSLFYSEYQGTIKKPVKLGELAQYIKNFLEN